MRILDNKKDYYDYLTGIYGIDNHITFDRRNSYVFKEFCDGHDFFIKTKCSSDTHKTLSFNWVSVNNRYKYIKDLFGKIHFIIIEIGKTHYLFKIERYIDDNDILQIEPSLIWKKENQLKKSNGVISVIPVHVSGLFVNDSYSISQWFIDKRIDLPIFNNTWVPSFIPADDIYKDIYDFIISEKEPKIVDNRTDVQKLESKGFDKKTSFRHPIK